MQTRHQLFDGTKATRLEDLPPEAWQVIKGEYGRSDIAKVWAAVAWLYRCVDIRAQTVATLPFEVRRGEEVVWSHEEPDPPDSLPWGDRLTNLLWQTETATVLEGKAYWFKESNLTGTQGVRWLHPGSVKPEFRKSDGRLQGFKRQRGKDQEAQQLRVDEVVHFWPPDPYVEIGPARNTPGAAAMNASNTLNSLGEFLEGYFERGMVKATLLTYNTPISSSQAQTVKTWWRRVFQGVKNAFSTEIIRGDFEPKIIGEGISDLQNSELTELEREAICTAMGVPQSIVTANAANFATAQRDDRLFITKTVAPRSKWLQGILNAQLFEPMDLSFRFLPEQLTEMQTDENERSESLLNLVNAGMKLEAAVEVLGYDIPDGLDFVDETPEPPPMMPGQQPPPPNPEAEEERATLRRWISNRQKDGRPIDLAQFETNILQPWEKAFVALDMGVEPEAANGQDNPFLDYP